ncbi:aldehyde reductase II [Fusarium pseudocircinatum]|uniref:Aldehyde reductase II n=1 Tax=Fusarium pseudocircinatum TaxID=56676 RepID=A0A8H5PXM5_9HYPO|nr:aldehyde reductase II [Fusarium pseudocircinatum]
MSPIHSTSFTIPKGSTILVTGVNGFIGSHVANEFLQQGYQVRGTARDTFKSAWIKDLFQQQYGKDNFSLWPVADLTPSHAFDKVIKGVAAVVHVASPLGLDSGTGTMIPDAIASALNALKAANSEPSVKRFVYTSSSTAAVFPEAEIPVVVDANTWNDKALSILQNSASAPEWYVAYAASKVEAERAVWDFYQNDVTRRSDLVVNTVLPSTNFGKSLDWKHQGYPSTSGFIRTLWSGTALESLTNASPQYFIDVQDDAKLHVAATLLPDVQGERIFPWAETWNLDQILAILRAQNPDRTFVKDFQAMRYLADIEEPRSRCIQLLQALGEPGFTSLEESIRLNSEDLARAA